MPEELFPKQALQRGTTLGWQGTRARQVRHLRVLLQRAKMQQQRGAQML